MHSKVTSELRNHPKIKKWRCPGQQHSKYTKDASKGELKERANFLKAGVSEQPNGEVILLARHHAILNGDRDKVTHEGVRNRSE
jgi:hypothetical protein